MDPFWAISHVVQWIVTLLLAVLVLALARQIGVLHARIPAIGADLNNDGPEIGDLVEAKDLPTIDGGQMTIGGPGQFRRLMLFLGAQCQTCAALTPAIRAVSTSLKGTTQIQIIGVDGERDENAAFIERHNLQQLEYALAPRLSALYGVTSIPYAVLVGTDGRVVTKGVVNRLEHLESLLEPAAGGAA